MNKLKSGWIIGLLAFSIVVTAHAGVISGWKTGLWGPVKITEVMSDSLDVIRAEIPETLTVNAVREIAGRFALALGLGTRDTFFLTYGAASADTTFFLETGDSTLIWSNTPNPFRIGPNGAIQIAADGKVILGVNGFHINTDADSTYLSKYAILGFIGDTAVVLRGHIGDTATVLRGDISDSLGAQNDVYVWAYLTTADQAIAYNTWTQVAFNAEKRDLGADFNTTTNEFTAPDSGFYVIGARANIQDNGGATNQGGSLIAIYRNDSMMVRGVKVMGFLGDPVALDMTDASCGPMVSATLYCPASATIQIYAYQDFQDIGGGLIKMTAEETWVTIRKVN